MQYSDLSHPLMNPASATHDEEKFVKWLYQEDSLNNNLLINQVFTYLDASATTCMIRPAVSEKQYTDKMNADPDAGNYMGNVIIMDIQDLYQPLHEYYDEQGKLCIDLDSEDRVNSYFEKLKNLQVTQALVEEYLLQDKVDIKQVTGILFYSNLSRYWTVERCSSWQYIYNLCLNLESKLIDYLFEQGVKFIGTDGKGIGHNILNYSFQERIFLNYHYLAEQLKQECSNLLATEQPCSALLNRGISIYRHLNISSKTASAKKAFFIGLPLKMPFGESYCLSPVRPLLMLNER